jgi:1-acyl-sn-glycerol-3-phosphate acyltransferase
VVRWFNVLCRLLFRGLLKAFADWHVYGRENLPWGEPFLVIANHQSNLDPPLISVSLGRPAKYLAKGTLFENPLSGFFFRHYGAFPINRDGRDLAGSKWALEQLRAGEPLVIFPEGGRNPEGMEKALSGAAFLATKARVPVVPAGITGSGRLQPMWRVFFPTGSLTVTFGEPFSLPVGNERLNREKLDSLTELMMSRVAQLLPIQDQGVYREEPGAPK